MKGLVFTELVDMVEEKFGLDVMDKTLSGCPMASNGAYTSVGTYDHNEILQLVAKLAELTGADPGELVRVFGRHLFGTLSSAHANFFEENQSTFDFLERVDSHIHVEVRKLYPDAELPSFTFERDGDKHLSMIYRSQRPFALLALGMIEGCAEHFGESFDIEYIDESDGVGNAATFNLSRSHAA